MGAIARISTHLLALTRRLITVAACADCCGSTWGGEPPSDWPDYPPVPWPPPEGGTIDECAAPCYDSMTYRSRPMPCAEPTVERCLECCCGCTHTEEWRERFRLYQAIGYTGDGVLMWGDSESIILARITCVCTRVDDRWVQECGGTYRARSRVRFWDAPEWTEWIVEDQPLSFEYPANECIPGLRVRAYPWSSATCDQYVRVYTDRVTCRGRRRMYRRDTGLDEFGGHRIDEVDQWSVITTPDTCAGTLEDGPCPGFHGMGAGDFLGDAGGGSGGGEA